MVIIPEVTELQGQDLNMNESGLILLNPHKANKST